jgi:hypothetical protein
MAGVGVRCHGCRKRCNCAVTSAVENVAEGPCDHQGQEDQDCVFHHQRYRSYVEEVVELS